MPLKIFNNEDREIAPPWTVRKPGVTEEEFLEMTTEDDRWELIDGEVIMNSPAFGTHEDLDGWLIRVVGDYVEHKGLGKVFPSNRMIHLGAGKILVPDVSFLSRARAGQETEKWIEAPVDWVCEIASPSSLRYDLGEKLDLYKKHGFGEVWIVNPEAREVRVSACPSAGSGQGPSAGSGQGKSEGRYEDRVVCSGRVESSALEGFWLDADWLWKRPLPSGLGSLKAILGVEKL